MRAAARHPALADIGAILFDKDGTLLDFDATWGPAAADVLYELADGDRAVIADLAASCGFDPATNRFTPDSPVIGGNTGEFTPQWATRLGVPFDDAFLRRIDAMFRPASLRHLAAYADVANGLRRLNAAGFPLGLATNDAEANAEVHLGALDVRGYFDFVCGYDSGFGAKPAGGMVAGFAAATGVPARRIALVGDTPHDMHEAKAGGAIAIGIARTERARSSLGDLPTVTVGDMAELLRELGL